MNLIRRSASSLIALVISLQFASPLPAHAATLAPVRLEPPITGILLLPPRDTEPWAANVLPQRQMVVRQRSQYELIARGFKIYGEALAAKAAEAPSKIDLSDASSRTPEAMDALAKRSGAQLVISMTVREVKEDKATATEKEFHCLCDIYVQIWDSSRHGWLIDGPFIGHDEGGSSSPVWLFKESIDNAVRTCIEQIFKDYPKVVTVTEVGKVYDYLEGQTEPFVGDAKTPFSGLKKTDHQ